VKKYLIEKIYSSNTKKDGSPLLNKEGKPFTKYSVLVADEWLELKGFGKEDVKSGDLIEAELQEKQGTGQWSDRTFKSLYIPKPDPTQAIAELADRVLVLEKAVFEGKQPLAGTIPPEIDEELDDIPF